jgi:hypothetical protein
LSFFPIADAICRDLERDFGVPARRIEERRHEPPIVYALGSLERAEQDARRVATPTSRIGGEKWRFSGRGADASD